MKIKGLYAPRFTQNRMVVEMVDGSVKFTKCDFTTDFTKNILNNCMIDPEVSCNPIPEHLWRFWGCEL